MSRVCTNYWKTLHNAWLHREYKAERVRSVSPEISAVASMLIVMLLIRELIGGRLNMAACFASKFETEKSLPDRAHGSQRARVRRNALRPD
jgi:hypothetical protein